MKVNVRGTLKGRIKWQHIRNGKVIQEGEQDNLITNAGMHAFANVTQGSLQGNFRSHAAVGTGSAEPQHSSTAVEGEVMRVATTSMTSSLTDSEGGRVLIAPVRAVFTFTGAHTIASAGLYAASSGGLCNILELIRDNGTPIALSVQANDQFTYEHTTEYAVAPGTTPAPMPEPLVINEYDRADAPLGAFTIDCDWNTTNNGSNAVHYFEAVLPATPPNIARYTAASGVTAAAGSSLVPYESNFSRRKIVRIPEAGAGNNSAFSNFQIGGYYPSQGGGLIITRTGGDEFIKEDTHTLEFVVEVSWARADEEEE